MLIRWLVAAIHLLALGVGLGGIWARARGLRALREPAGLKPVFLADSFWGLSAILWVSTGVWRALGGLEKGSDYYLGAPMFHLKMTLLGIILLLELGPMVTLVRWRIRLARGEAVDLSPARRFAVISEVQTGLVVLMVFVAAALARGIP